jgi:YggT family protein
MLELLGFISSLITLYIYIVIASAVMSWLIAFNVVNPYNQFVRSIWQGLNALTEPVLRPIRRLMPDLGGIDISPWC